MQLQIATDLRQSFSYLASAKTVRDGAENETSAGGGSSSTLRRRTDVFILDINKHNLIMYNMLKYKRLYVLRFDIDITLYA